MLLLLLLLLLNFELRTATEDRRTVLRSPQAIHGHRCSDRSVQAFAALRPRCEGGGGGGRGSEAAKVTCAMGMLTPTARGTVEEIPCASLPTCNEEGEGKGEGKGERGRGGGASCVRTR